MLNVCTTAAPVGPGGSIRNLFGNLDDYFLHTLCKYLSQRIVLPELYRGIRAD